MGRTEERDNRPPRASQGKNRGQETTEKPIMELPVRRQKAILGSAGPPCRDRVGPEESGRPGSYHLLGDWRGFRGRTAGGGAVSSRPLYGGW